MGTYKAACLATPGIALFWDLDDTGATAADSVGSNTGTYVGGYTQSVLGESGNGVTFNGSTGYVTTATLPTTAATNITLECWFRCTGTTAGDHAILFLGNLSPETGHAMYHGGGMLRAYLLGVSYGGPSDPTFRANEWHHAALVIDASGHPTLYLDGLSCFTSSNVALAPSGGCFRVGANGGPGQFFPGSVDGVAVYTAALSAATLLAHYKAGERAFKGPKQFPARPVAPPALDGGNPIVSGLVVAAPLGLAGAGLLNLIDRRSADLINNSGGIGGTPTWATGRYSANELDATRDVTPRPRWSHKPVRQRSFTAETWATIRGYTNVYPYISAAWSNLVAGGTLLLWYGNTDNSWDRLTFAVGSSANNLYLPFRVQLGEPHQYVVVGTATDVKLYMDGALVATNVAPDDITFAASTLLQGNNNALRQQPDGQVHQYNLWDRPLSATEIRARYQDPWGLYDAPATPPPTFAAPPAQSASLTSAVAIVAATSPAGTAGGVVPEAMATATVLVGATTPPASAEAGVSVSLPLANVVATASSFDAIRIAPPPLLGWPFDQLTIMASRRPVAPPPPASLPLANVDVTASSFDAIRIAPPPLLGWPFDQLRIMASRRPIAPPPPASLPLANVVVTASSFDVTSIAPPPLLGWPFDQLRIMASRRSVAPPPPPALPLANVVVAASPFDAIRIAPPPPALPLANVVVAASPFDVTSIAPPPLLGWPFDLPILLRRRRSVSGHVVPTVRPDVAYCLGRRLGPDPAWGLGRRLGPDPAWGRGKSV